jgi:hypothetical protein
MSFSAAVSATLTQAIDVISGDRLKASATKEATGRSIHGRRSAL